MVRLSGIGLRRRRHGYLMQAHNVVKFLDIEGTVLLLLHGKMHGNAEIHLLRRLKRNMLSVPYHITGKEKVQSGIGEEVISSLVHHLRQLFHFLLRISLQNIASVKSLLGQIAKLLIEAVKRAALFRPL